LNCTSAPINGEEPVSIKSTCTYRGMRQLRCQRLRVEAGRSIIFGEVEGEGNYGSDVESEMRGDVDGGRDEGSDSVDGTTSGGYIDSTREDAGAASWRSQDQRPSTKVKYDSPVSSGHPSNPKRICTRSLDVDGDTEESKSHLQMSVQTFRALPKSCHGLPIGRRLEWRTGLIL